MFKMMKHQSCDATLTVATAETNGWCGLERGIKEVEERERKKNVKLAVQGRSCALRGSLKCLTAGPVAPAEWGNLRSRTKRIAKHTGRWFNAECVGENNLEHISLHRKVLIMHARQREYSLQIKRVRLAKYRLYWTWKFNNQSTLRKESRKPPRASEAAGFLCLSVCLQTAALFILEPPLQWVS